LQKIIDNNLESIDFKTAHRMSSDGYISYDSHGEFSEPLIEIIEQTNKSISESVFESITRLKQISFNYEFNKLKDIDFETNEYEFFWSNDSPYSQWHKANFKLNDVEYTSAEQFMMAKKAEFYDGEKG